MGGRKTVGVVFSEAFEMIKREYKALWVISLIMCGVGLALGMVTSVFALPLQIFSGFLGPIFSGISRQSGSYGDVDQILRGAVPALSVFGIFYLVIMAVSIAVSIAQEAAAIGANNATLQLLDGGKPRFDAVWQNFARNWKRYVGISAWKMLWAFLLQLPVLVIGIGVTVGLAFLTMANPMFIILSFIAVFITTLAALAVYYYKALCCYGLAPYLIIEYPDMPVREAMQASVRITEGYRGRLFVLSLIVAGFSFASLLGLCVLIIGYYAISLLWVMPLFYAMFAIAYRDIKAAAIERGILPASQPLV